jgi:hypothetical protein
MSKASQIVILCEDKAHEVLVTRFLKKGWNVHPRAIHVHRSYPAGKGSAKKFVEDHLAQEVKALRTRSASTILVVVRDADEEPVDRVRMNLDAKIDPPRGDREPIVYFLPKWHIQTWIAFLDGEAVDEGDRSTYRQRYEEVSETRKAHPYVDHLADLCRDRAPLAAPPGSLLMACDEFDRIRDILRDH